MTTPDLHGQVAIVTGAGSGIGRATALALAQSGVRVVLAARTQQNLEVVFHDITTNGGTALVVPTDVGEEREIARLVTRTQEQFGRLDILVTSAGGASLCPLIKSRTAELGALIVLHLRRTDLLRLL